MINIESEEEKLERAKVAELMSTIKIIYMNLAHDPNVSADDKLNVVQLLKDSAKYIEDRV